MIDLDDFKRRYVVAWGDRMTVGVPVGELRQVVEQLETLQERLTRQQTTLEAAEVQRAYWERMARAAYVEQQRLQLQIDDLVPPRKSEPPE